jgi:hypothetical protein
MKVGAARLPAVNRADPRHSQPCKDFMTYSRYPQMSTRVHTLRILLRPSRKENAIEKMGGLNSRPLLCLSSRLVVAIVLIVVRKNGWQRAGVLLARRIELRGVDT